MKLEALKTYAEKLETKAQKREQVLRLSNKPLDPELD